MVTIIPTMLFSKEKRMQQLLVKLWLQTRMQCGGDVIEDIVDTRCRLLQPLHLLATLCRFYS